MRSRYAEGIQALSRIRGVVAAMIVGQSDGIVIDAAVRSDTRADVVAALAASLYRRARLAAAAAGLGDIGVLQLEAEDGRILVLGAGELVIVAVAVSRSNIGLIRMQMIREAEALS